MSDKLLPCPFCGGDSLAFVTGSTFKWHKIECNTCGASCGEVRRDGDNTADLAEEWNTRPDSKPYRYADFNEYRDSNPEFEGSWARHAFVSARELK